ncbi:LAQU0S01e04940g1_1 [Lachancea quebecensis]|uniref:Translation initiation factor eIF2B subunit gamma n=1 Tax=Lachancea quebecensis TaxID=1654605 RepID=A0A0P1KL97_9SACH|nr:LAQU0S01e04940g1_1 [Lachancea quebecensis]
MDFQAFIFCGKGYNLAPFTQTKGDTGVSKALLPVANRHMIEYVLDWCEQANFKEINVVADGDEIDVIHEALANYMKIRECQYDILAKTMAPHHSQHLRKPIPIHFIASKGETTGAILQRELLSKITGDFVLLPCDFITDIPPQIFIDQYRNKDPDNLAMSVSYRNTFENIDKKQLDFSYTVYSENEDSVKQPVLLDVYSKRDVEKSKYLQIRTHLLWRYPNASVSKKLLNSSIYFCSYELVDLLTEENKLSFTSETESEEFEDDTVTSESHRQVIKPTPFRKRNKLVKDPINCCKPLTKVFRDLGRRSWQHSAPRETTGVFILPSLGCFIRSNVLSAYMEANRYMLRMKASMLTAQGVPAIGSSAVGADSIIGAECSISEKTSVKLSVLGKNCKIGKRCRIVGCVILDGVEIDDECILENAVIGNFTKIGKKCKLTNSYVEGSYIVNPRTVLKGETLTHIFIEESEDTSDSLESSEEEDTSEYSDDYDDDFEDDGLFER